MQRPARHTLAVVLGSVGLTMAVVAGVWSPASVAAQNAATTTATLTVTATATQTRTPRPTAGPTFTPTLTPGPNQYVVQSGDYLAKIATRFGISVKRLKEANNLLSDFIYPGQILAIPPRATVANPTRTTTALPPGARTHVVKEGDQLIKLARTYGVPVDQLLQANGLTTDQLRVGQVLFVPTPMPVATPDTPTAVPAVWITYRVQAGARLQPIAIWCCLTWPDIIAANCLLGSGTTRVRHSLSCLNPPRRPVVYTVQEGDSLESLSERFQISVDFIRIANYNFRGDVLYAGLPLIIPMRPEMIP